MTDLTILPVKKPSVKLEKLNPVLPPHAFLMGIVAPPRAGKSNLIANLLANENFYYNGTPKKPSYFDDIYYLSPTSRFDLTTKNYLAKMDNVVCISDPDDLMQSDTIIEQLQKEQAEADEDDRKKILVVLDDMVGIIEKLPKLISLATKFRHYSMNIIIVSQSYRRIPLTIRNCFTALICFDLKNAREFNKISDEFTGSIPDSEQMIKEIVKKRYDFFYFNIEKQQLYHNFHTLKWSRDESEITIPNGKKDVSDSSDSDDGPAD